MENSVIILFFSKYSNSSLELIKEMEEYLNFKKICVDNKDIRSTILNESEKYNIQEVPCIFIFYSNGIIHKYEGEKAFQWANQILNTYKESKKILPPTEPNIQKHVSFQELQSIEDITMKTNTIKENNSNNNIISQEYTPENLVGMKRKIETSPIIEPNQSHVDINLLDNRNEIKKISDKKHDSILNMAQNLQAQREKEDETFHPSAITKINFSETQT